MALYRLIFLIFCVQPYLGYGHIPVGGDYEWAEPNAPSTVMRQGAPTLSRETSLARVTSLRQVMAALGVSAYIVPTADAHNSQYIAPADARRVWVSGLSGSSGTAVVTASEARLWTDSRYFTQFDIQVDATVWSLMRQGSDLTINQWLVATLQPGSVVALDPTTYTRSAWNTLQGVLTAANITLEAIDDNLVDIARTLVGDPPPPRPNDPLQPLGFDFHGKVASEKIADLKAEINSRGASALVLTALDDIAYTLNLRGTDIPYNPVFFAYLIIRVDSTDDVVLFWGSGSLAGDVEAHLAAEGVAVHARPYSNFFNYLQTMAFELQLQGDRAIWLSQDGSHAVHLAAESEGRTRIISSVSPVALVKCVKNDVELQGFRSAHVKDGVAVVRFMRWVHERVGAGDDITEIDVSDKLLELRGEEQDFMGPSFTTIVGAGENGAIIHYAPERDGPQRVIRADDVLLVDSGAQYRDGTTDITRVRHMGTPTPAQRNANTRVLKGQIMMGTAVFPQGSTGNVLDSFARKALWDVGLNYGHGTGHGVGHYLNVHEGPSGIGSGAAANDPGIRPGMIFSNEPGYYEVGEYGIRHEDLVEVIEMNRDADHVLAKSMVGDFDGRGAVAFYTISLAPHQTSFLDVNLLNELEIKYINDYHARVLATLGPILTQRGLIEDYDWLERECAPIGRSSAILFSATPLLVVVISAVKILV